MADETLDKKPDDLAPTDAEGSKPADEVSAALDKPAEDKPADPVTEAIRAEDKPLDEAVAIEAEGKPDEALEAAQEAPQEPAADATPGASTGDPEPDPLASSGSSGTSPAAPISDTPPATDGEPVPEEPVEDAHPTEATSPSEAPPSTTAGSAGGSTPSMPPTPEVEAGPSEAGPSKEAKPAEPEAPKAPTFGDVKGEVMDLHDQLPADTLDTLRAGGCSLFLFLADMAECDTSGLSQEGRARISNVRNQAQMLLAAIESVFVRHG